MLNEITGCVERGESFAFESTLAGMAYLRHIKNWRDLGYHVSLFFLSLRSADMAVARVAERVRQGGHDIPEVVIRRRFDAGKKHFDHGYRAAVDAWALYDNSGNAPILIEWGERL
jgi:predicted ABC-type ATPase